MYSLKQLLGQQDPQLLQAKMVLSWTLVQQMRDEAVILHESQKALAHKLSAEILKTSTITQREVDSGLQFGVQVYVYNRDQLQELLGQAYDLGKMAVKPRPNYYNSEIS